MKMKFARFMTVGLGMCWVLAGIAGNGLPSLEPNVLELRRMPIYCQAKFGMNKGTPEARAWYQRIGKKNYLHIHHYCYALADIDRASLMYSSPKKRSFLLKRAIGNINYVLQRWKPTVPLYREALLKKSYAESILKMGQ